MPKQCLQVTALPGNDHRPPAWSPDGGQLAYTADGEENAGDIFVVDVTTLEAVRPTEDEAYDMFPAWRHEHRPQVLTF